MSNVDFCRQDLILGKSFLKKNKNKSLVVVGLGGIGSQIFLSLIKQGFSNVGVIDFDVLEFTDLHRHAFAVESDVGKYKVDLGFEHGAKWVINKKLGKDMLRDADLVFDATDNLRVRRLINKQSLEYGFAWVFSSGVSTNFSNSFFTGKKSDPCFECLFKGKKDGPSCSDVGVLNQTVWIPALISVNQGINFLMNRKSNLLIGKLLTGSLNPLSFNVINYKKRKICICA